MAKRSRFVFVVGVAGFLCGGFIATSARADMSAEEYRQAISIAQKKVERDRGRAKSRAQSLLAASIGVGGIEAPSALGHEYRVGESWDVAAMRFAPSPLLPPDQRITPKTKKGTVSFFRYEVTEVKSQPEGITLSVTPLDPKVDPSVERVVLGLSIDSSRVSTDSKSYVLKQLSDPVPVAPQGLRSKVSALEFFPLELPETFLAEGVSSHDAPELPDVLLRKIAAAGYSQLGASANDSSGFVRFEDDDSFGRPVRLLWKKGDAWPQYVEGSQGVAVLVRKGGAQ